MSGKAFFVIVGVIVGGAFLYEFFSKPSEWYGTIILILIGIIVTLLWEAKEKSR